MSFFSVYKPGQGYWTRVLTATGAGILVLAGAPAPGTPLADVLPLGDDVIEFEITPNRPDCLSVYGIAREVAGSLRPARAAQSGNPRQVIELEVKLTRIYAMRPPERAP